MEAEWGRKRGAELQGSDRTYQMLYGQGPNGKIDKQGTAQGYPAGQGTNHHFILLYIRMTIKIQTGSLQLKNIVSVKLVSYFIVRAVQGMDMLIHTLHISVIL